MKEEFEIQQVSMRKGALKVLGGTLDNLYSSRRFDSPWHNSRMATHHCRKDWRTWRRGEVIVESKFDRRCMKKELDRIEKSVQIYYSTDESPKEYLNGCLHLYEEAE